MDEVLVDGTGRVVAQRTLEDLRVRTSELGHDLDDGAPSLVDIVGARSCIGSSPTESQCALLFDVWSFLEEVARSTGRPMRFAGEDARRAYDKVFWGMGTLRPDNVEPWHPWLSSRQQRKLHQIITRGIDRFGTRIGAGRDARFERITVAINAEDPAGLIDLECPYYEYDIEAVDLWELTGTASALDVRRVFDEQLGENHHLSDDAAERIAAAVRQP
jgi:hypothetical protein